MSYSICDQVIQRQEAPSSLPQCAVLYIISKESSKELPTVFRYFHTELTQHVSKRLLALPAKEVRRAAVGSGGVQSLVSLEKQE